MSVLNTNDIIKAGFVFYDPQKREDILSKITLAIQQKQYNKDDLQTAFNYIRSYLLLPMFLQRLGEKKDSFIQSYISEQDLAQIRTQALNISMSLKNFDSNCLLAFKEIDFDSNKDYFEIIDILSELELKPIRDGEQVEFLKVRTGQSIVKSVYYGLGVEIPRRLLELGEYSSVFNILEQLRNAYFITKYNSIYKLLVETAYDISNPPINYQTGASTAERDINTINKVSADLGDINKNKADFHNFQYPMLIYCHPFLEARLRGAINYTSYQSGSVGSVATSRPIQIIPTYNLAFINGNPVPQTVAIAVLPGGKNLYAEKVPAEFFSNSDITRFTEITTIRTGYAVNVDMEQVKRVNFA